MSDGDTPRTELSLLDTLERLRMEKFPQVPRDLVREVLRLHADTSASAFDLANRIETLVREYSAEAK